MLIGVSVWKDGLEQPVSGAAPVIDSDAQAWINSGANADPAKADALVRALKAVGFTSSNAFADIKAAGGTIQMFRGLTAGGATIPDLFGLRNATPLLNPPFNPATGYTLDGNTQSIDTGLTVIQTANYFAILFCNHVTFTANDGLFSDADAVTPAVSCVQRTSTDNRFRTTLTRASGTTSLRDSAAAYLTGIDYQMGFLLSAQMMQPYSNVANAESFVPDGAVVSLAGENMRAASGTLKLGRAANAYGNLQVHAFVAAPLAPTAQQLQNLVDAMEVFWS